MIGNVKYVDSNTNNIGLIPENWGVSKVKFALSQIKDGTHGTFPRTTEGRPLLSAKNVYSDSIIISETESMISEEDYIEITKNGFPKKGDLLLTTVGTIGRVYLYDLDEPLAFQRSVAFLRLSKNYNPRYYFYYFQSDHYLEELMCYAKTSAQSGVYMGDVAKTHIVVPPKELQAKIADFLDIETLKINSVIKDKERMIRLLEQQRQSIIIEAVTKGLNRNAKMKDSGIEWIGEIPEHWSTLSLKHIASEKKNSFVDGPFGSDLKNEEYVDSGVPVIQLNNIRKGKLRITSMNFVTEEKSEQLKRHIAYPGDLVIAKMASPIARSAVVPETYQKYVIVADCIKLKLKENYLNQYINYVMNTPFIIAQAESFANGTTRSRVNLSIIKNLKLPIPNLEEQKEIVSYLTLKVSEVNYLISAIENQIQKLKEYRQSLIYEVVTGKIDVRDMELD